MAQKDIHLTQNTASSGIEFEEKIVNLTPGAVLKADTNGLPTEASAGTDYQAALESGVNIKTINNESLLGPGNITITGGGGSGDVTGPASSTAGNLAVFADTTGKVIEDGGPVPTVPTDLSDLSDTTGLLDFPNVQDPINLSEYDTGWETGTAYLFGDKRSDLALGIQVFIRCINPHTSTGGYWAENDTANWALVSYFFADVSALTDDAGIIPTDVSDLNDSTGLIPSITGLLDETAHDALDHTGLTGVIADAPSDGNQYARKNAAWEQVTIPSTAKIVELKVYPENVAISTGDLKTSFVVPLALNGWQLTSAHAVVATASSSGLPNFQIRNATTGFDMLSTPITIDATELNSYTALTQPVVNATYKVVATGNRIAVDNDGIGTGTLGQEIILVFEP